MVVRGNADGPGKKSVKAEEKKTAAAAKAAGKPKAKPKAKGKDGKLVVARTAVIDDGNGNVTLPEAAQERG